MLKFIGHKNLDVSFAASKIFFNHQTPKIMFNYIKQIAAITLVLLCLIGCQSIGKKSQVTIQSQTLAEYNMMQNDKFGDKKTDALTRNTPLSKNDHFPKFYTFMLNHKVRAMYVRPKNKVVTVVERDNAAGLDKVDSLGFLGVSYPDENIILQELNRRFSAFQGYTLGLDKRKRDLKDAYNSSARIYFEEQKYLKEAFKKYKTGRDFRKAVLREIRYSYICNLIGPFSKAGVNVDSISQEYVGQVNSLKKEMRNIIKTRNGTDKNVQLTVYDFNRFLSRKAMKSDTAFDYQWLMAEQNFKGETREFLKFRLLRENYGAIPNYGFYLEKFKKTCKDKDFVTYLDDFEKKNAHEFNQSELETTLSDTAGQSLRWADILAKNKGKKIYLMISSFPVESLYGQQLANQKADFEQNNTEVIFFSTAYSKEQWLKSLKKGAANPFFTVDSSTLKAMSKREETKPKMSETKPIQSYHLGSDDSTLLRLLQPKDGESKLLTSVLIDENGKVVLSQAADPANMGLLMRQLKHGVKAKVPIP